MPTTHLLSAAPAFSVGVESALIGATRFCAASPSFAVVGSASLSGSSALLGAAPAFAVNAGATLSGATVALSAVPAFSVKGSATLSGAAVALSAAPSFSMAGAATLSGTTAFLAAAPRFEANAAADLTGASDEHGMSICDVVSAVLAMWGIFCRLSAPGYALDRALSDINQALQLVWNNADGRTFWTNQTLEIILGDGESSQDLGDDIQTVTGPCRRQDNRLPLSTIGTIGELETFTDTYLDGNATDVPVAYHIERLAQAGNDPARTIFHTNSAVSGVDVTFLLEVVKEAPRFTRGDLVACPLVPIPHGYVESLLLPVARYNASSYYLFRLTDQKETIDREYQQARKQLGLADPLPGNSGDNKKKGPEE